MLQNEWEHQNVWPRKEGMHSDLARTLSGQAQVVWALELVGEGASRGGCKCRGIV